MADVTIYHNPRCGKSRQTLELLQQRRCQVQVVEYLKTPPDEKTLRRLLTMLGLTPLQLMRTKEPLFQELNLQQCQDQPDKLIAAMVEHPILIERPIVVHGQQARLGRPPEKVLEIL